MSLWQTPQMPPSPLIQETGSSAWRMLSLCAARVDSRDLRTSPGHGTALYPVFWLQHMHSGADNYMSSSSHFLKCLKNILEPDVGSGKHSWTQRSVFQTSCCQIRGTIKSLGVVLRNSASDKKKERWREREREGDIFTRWMKAARDRRKSRRRMLST